MRSFNKQCPHESPEITCKHFNRCADNYKEIGKILLTTHHEFWPKSSYKTKLERQFRELPENKTRICAQEHDDLHACNLPPEKPERYEMLQAVEDSEELRVIHEWSEDE